MLKALLSGAFLIVSLNATSIDDVIKNALENNSSLQELAIEEQITYEKIELSDEWMNPVLSMGITDVQSDISKRDLEPMQATFIGVTQNIPLGNRLELKRKVAQSDYEISSLILQNEQLKLRSIIKGLGYDYLILDEKLKLLLDYKKRIHALDELTRSLYENDKASLEKALQTALLKERVELKITNTEMMKKRARLALEQKSFLKIKTLEGQLEPKLDRSEINIDQHPQLAIFRLQAKKSITQSKVEESQKNSDLKFSMAYFKRDDKYNDYMNFSVAMPLSIYKSEDIKAKVAKLKSKSFENRESTIRQNFQTEVERLKFDLNSSYENILRYENKILPQREAIQQTLQSYNSLSLTSPEKTIRHLNVIIEEELLLLNEKQNFFKAQSQLDYYKGVDND